MRPHILDLDGALAGQPVLMGACAAAGGHVVAARDLAPRLRLQAQRAALATLGGRLAAPAPGDIYFYGSGDFHHLTLLLVERLEQPVSIIHFDNHPDWVRVPASVNCGSWVARALELRQVLRVVTIGPGRADMAAPQLKGADMASVRTGRLEIHPFASQATFYAGPAFETASAEGDPGIGRCGLRWHGLSDRDFMIRMADVADRLPDGPLWITLDKDVLTQREAVTNWDQGQLTLEQVLDAIALFAEHRPILGMDVCGDYSPEGALGPWRTFLAFCDRAQRPVPEAAGHAVNQAANLRILRHMGDLLS
ncbi:hypothetical protein [Azorhizobium doebereinerae]|uniref:hypothetical protein n=1 Tax=Azorhizobium doebereinerae TaxID=281091 RepID=UPI000424F5AC|nr:hypothetical protein [Azorhizobium doebereinerae]